MIDRGLLATVVIIVGVITLLDRRLRRRGEAREPILAMASGPLMAGLAAARLAAVALDDPGVLRRPFDLLLIRGGMEFWAGMGGAAVMIWFACRREQTSGWHRLADLAPFALWAYAAFEATCVVRDGCFGPSSSLGLRPGGLGEPQLPTGLLVGVAVGGVATVLWRARRRLSATVVVAAGVVAVAGARSVSGFALPKVTAGLTRPHRESLAVLTVGVLIGAGTIARRAFGATGPRHSASPAPGLSGLDDGPTISASDDGARAATIRNSSNEGPRSDTL